MTRDGQVSYDWGDVDMQARGRSQQGLLTSRQPTYDWGIRQRKGQPCLGAQPTGTCAES